MLSILNYVGPGLALGTIVIVVIVLLVILASIIMIIWTPIKNLFRRIRQRLVKK